jgi:hypothetical protein
MNSRILGDRQQVRKKSCLIEEKVIPFSAARVLLYYPVLFIFDRLDIVSLVNIQTNLVAL